MPDCDAHELADPDADGDTDGDALCEADALLEMDGLKVGDADPHPDDDAL